MSWGGGGGVLPGRERRVNPFRRSECRSPAAATRCCAPREHGLSCSLVRLALLPAAFAALEGQEPPPVQLSGGHTWPQVGGAGSCRLVRRVGSKVLRSCGLCGLHGCRQTHAVCMCACLPHTHTPSLCPRSSRTASPCTASPPSCASGATTAARCGEHRQGTHMREAGPGCCLRGPSAA